ncbi:hypothetical protein [Roseovarius aestuarii]|uniref:Thermophilic metalloprotease (M29) n=1 Tax=Roseovarius aestuarii TaxID=475083 RepID=A0A1X7BQ07_9RHOB|nr:hypothetical protein [Roseovarius aestuarii]SMC11299.1 hypothetical protein ROA7745_01111 [Roseovarius aestuarii]
MAALDEIEPGVRNLLLNCARAQPGDRVLLVGEKGDNPYFNPAICDAVASIARRHDMVPEVVMAAPVADASQFPSVVHDAMLRADRTIFFSRLGDQVRFSLPGDSAKVVMTYTLDLDYLAAPFASADFGVMKQVHDALLALILKAQTYRLTGACGTDLTSDIASDREGAVADFALELFPVMIFPPVICHNMNGTLVIRHFVTSSSTRAYEDSTLVIDHPVLVEVENSRMVGFDGPPDLVARLKAQLERAAALTGGDPYRINSWHTGINPNTYFRDDPYTDLERWGTVAYGSPRYTHMHVAGLDPGDAALHLMDMTISFDDQTVWDKGRFVFLDRPEIQAMMDAPQRALLNSSVRHSIGI